MRARLSIAAIHVPRLFRRAGLMAAIVVMTVRPALADPNDEDVIEYRQRLMITLNEQSRALGQILAGTAPATNAATHLEILALTASLAAKAFEPKVQGGNAKAEIWTRWDDFSKRMDSFAAGTAQASAVAKEKGAAKALENILDTLTCKACHDVYRDEKKR